MLVMGELFLEYVKLYRSVWFSGRLGGGKTSLAVYVAKVLEKEGYKVISNIPVSGAIRIPRPEDFSRAVVLLDEAADFMDAYEFKNDIVTSFKYLRHYDLIVLLPCTDKVHARMRKLIVERVFRFEALLPLPRPIWLYRFWVGPEKWRKKESIGSYFLFLPSSTVFSSYSSTHGGRGVTTLSIIDALYKAIVVPSENIIKKERLEVGSEDVVYIQ